MTEHFDEPGHRHGDPGHGLREAGTIPVLRLDNARRTDGTFDEAFITELRAALHRIGFLQLTGYGAAPGQVGALTAAAARFFALPLAERLRLDNRLSPHFRGYTRLGHEITAGQPDAREQIDFAPEQAPTPRIGEGLCGAPSGAPRRPSSVLSEAGAGRLVIAGSFVAGSPCGSAAM